jgi:transcriptional regulator
MNTPDIFKPRDDRDIDRLVAAYPLALVISAVDGDLQASPLPLVLQRDAQGQGSLVGHFSRFNPQLEVVRRNGRALVAFSGAQGYIEEMGPRFEQLATAIVPFRARILSTQVQFKLGQGEPATVLQDSLAALEKYGQFELASAMRRQHALDGAAATAHRLT